jgi:fructokinase
MGGGGELGHTVLHSNGNSCYCGRLGCAEQYLSGPAIEALYPNKNEKLSSKEIFEKAKEGDALCKVTVHAYQENLVQFLTNLTNIFDPHFIVLGGGVSNQDEIRNNIEKKISEKCFLKSFPPKIYKHKFGDSAGVIGALLLPFIQR